MEKYHVDVPDFQMKANKWERFIHLLASPAKDPFESLISTVNGVFILKMVPLLGSAAFALMQVLFFL
jgi:hypothetical protein